MRGELSKRVIDEIAGKKENILSTGNTSLTQLCLNNLF